MDHFTAHRLRFDAEVTTPIEIGEHKGSAIRGALYHSLRRRFCLNHQARDCRYCSLAPPQHGNPEKSATCPVCSLVSTLGPESERGVDLPRPYTIEPPLGDGLSYEPSQHLEFGLTLFAEALHYFPYIILAVQAMETTGLGKRTKTNGWRRGTFRVRHVLALNPLTGESHEVAAAGQSLVAVPDVPITHRQVLRAASTWSATGKITLNFLTPTRITDAKHLQHRPFFRPIFQRLLERLSALARQFSDTPMTVDFGSLVKAANEVRVVEDHTRWVEVRSYSTRQGRATPTSGFIGQVSFEAEEWTPFLPWLLWGQFTHVGKDAVKGNGWYVMSNEIQ
ncbi:MAG: CRISPR system precrRNA processing endoribonuclease RAMP protein Cas6 [Chloroflexi bacterium]|nr:CRISPR system precrRNA processing endoribonuclease RAMP protein Cas6 [Chloroflexota bacterium]